MATPSTSSTRLSLLAKYSAALSSFTSSGSKFRIIHSISPTSTTITTTTNPSAATTQPILSPASASAATTKRLNLYILDSSFNPPTLAHLRLASSALLSDTDPSAVSTTSTSTPTPKRLLLLLATQNADKPAQPAAPEHRLAMMTIFAAELLAQTQTATQTHAATHTSTRPQDAIIEGIDIGLTTCPYFVDKSAAVTASGAYPPQTTTQVHLTGYDTLVRMLDAKYYPPGHELASMRALLEDHRLRVTYRTGSEWGERDAQDGFLREIAEGRREGEGMRREWVREGRVVLVEGREEGEEVVSSTRVREAVRLGDGEVLRRLVTEGVAEWILEERLYLQE